MSSLLSRFAANSYWMARYMQRAENLSRILEVNESFARNSDGENEWLPILRLQRDEALFTELYRRIDRFRVVRFYITDESNPNSIRQCVAYARENARSIRHLISLESWVQVNVLHNWIRGLSTRSLRQSELSRLCGRIKEGCQAHFGIADSTMYRDQVYLFFHLGRLIELCDQTTRLVDIKYHSLLPAAEDVGTPLDVSQWNALLRSASAYHGYRRAFPKQMTPTTVAGFILLDEQFPRSIRYCTDEIGRTLRKLKERAELAAIDFPSETLDTLEALSRRTPEGVVSYGLHEYLDEVQVALNRLGDEISGTYFLERHSAA